MSVPTQQRVDGAVIPSSFGFRHRQCSRLEHVTELQLFGLEVFRVMRIRLGTDGHLLDHFQTVPFESNDFLRVVCQEAELAHTEIEKNLRAESVIAQVARVAQPGVGLDGVQSSLLQFVSVNFCRQPDAASFLTHVNQNAVAFLLDLPKRGVQLIATIASPRAEHVAGKTLTMDPHERWLWFVNFPFSYR